MHRMDNIYSSVQNIQNRALIVIFTRSDLNYNAVIILLTKLLLTKLSLRLFDIRFSVFSTVDSLSTLFGNI